MVAAGAGDQAAGTGAQRLSGRRLPAGRDRARGAHPGRARLRQRGVRGRRLRLSPGPRGLQPHRRHRPGAHRAGPVLRAGGQLPHPFGRQLHAGEPRDHDAHVPAALSREPHRPGGDLSAAFEADARLGGAAEVRGRARGGDPDAGALQLGLLRALVPRRHDGRAAGRGGRPLRRGRLLLDAHDRRAAEGRRDLSADRRRVPRPAVFPGRTRCWGCRG